jgi:hypothetical protein
MFIFCAVGLFMGAVTGRLIIVDSLCLGEFLVLPSLIYMTMEACFSSMSDDMFMVMSCFYLGKHTCFRLLYVKMPQTPISYVFFCFSTYGCYVMWRYGVSFPISDERTNCIQILLLFM